MQQLLVALASSSCAAAESVAVALQRCLQLGEGLVRSPGARFATRLRLKVAQMAMPSWYSAWQLGQIMADFNPIRSGACHPPCLRTGLVRARAHMQVIDNILKAIGHTPLVKLNKLVGPNDADGAGQARVHEPRRRHQGPHGALHHREGRARRGLLKPGGTIVENTSGNTGMGVALAAAVKGYRCIFTIPDKMSKEKIDSLKAFGAEVVVTATNVPAESPAELLRNREAHRPRDPQLLHAEPVPQPRQHRGPLPVHRRGDSGSRPEGDFDVFVAGLGTGGTMSGAGKYFKEKKPAIRNVGRRPHRLGLRRLLQDQEARSSRTSTRSRASARTCSARPWTSRCSTTSARSTTSSASPWRRRLAREEGLFAGGSSRRGRARRRAAGPRARQGQDHRGDPARQRHPLRHQVLSRTSG